MNVKCIGTLADIVPAQWDALIVGRHPLLSHAFLYAMEQHGCLTEASGWIPRYLVIEEQNELIAAMPLYEKTNSWGEFVFDHAWADAYARYGLDYYPKLVSAIPFSPVFGQKLLLKPGREQQLKPILLDAIYQVAEQTGASSAHILFPLSAEQRYFEKQGWLPRHDCQYHWKNRDYASFEGFLSELTSKKRKNIRQERRKVEKAGIRFRQLDGDTADTNDWRDFTRFYDSTYQRKWGAPIFSQPFFESVAKKLGERMILLLADHGDKCIAGALMYRSDSVLYGRHWGCSEYHPALHFETCYYQGIEFCIRKGIQIFEPGAQGEHKIARGFIPVRTHSTHWLKDTRFRPAVEQFCKQESKATRQHIDALESHNPFRKPEN